MERMDIREVEDKLNRFMERNKIPKNFFIIVLDGNATVAETLKKMLGMD